MMRVENIMQRDVRSIREDDTVLAAAMMMREENLGFLPVVDAEGRALGAVTDRDITVRLCAFDARPSETRVGEVMTRQVIACTPEDDIKRVEQLMTEYHKSRVLVLDERGAVVGVVTMSDVVKRDSNKHAAHTLRKIVSREYRF
jgi:CBS domain-containing protein